LIISTGLVMMSKHSKFADKLNKLLGYVMAILAIVIVVVVFGGAYYLVIAPNLVQKPFVEKPTLPSDALAKIEAGEEVIVEGHINYLINEIGAYKLKKVFGIESYPVMEFVITDTNERYYSYIKDHKPVSKKGNAKGEDIVITGSQEIILKILESDNIQAAVKEANDNEEIHVELVADMKTLASKGYLSIYDALK